MSILILAAAAIATPTSASGTPVDLQCDVVMGDGKPMRIYFTVLELEGKATYSSGEYIKVMPATFTPKVVKILSNYKIGTIEYTIDRTDLSIRQINTLDDGSKTYFGRCSLFLTAKRAF